jgi:TetR/AcrR family transcriptional regulator
MTPPRTLTTERETAILDAAQKRFARFGISKVTMEEIASDVGLGKASLYYYFPTKQDVFRAVLEREEKEYLAALRGIMMQEIEHAEKLKLFVRQRLELFATFLNLAQFKADSWTAMRPAFQVLFRTMEMEEHRFLTGILKEGAKRREFSIAEPGHVATLLLHLLHGLRLRVIQNSETPTESSANYAELGREIGQLLDILLTGIMTKKRTTHPS